MDFGLLLLHGTIGAIFAARGLGKLFGVLGGPGLAGATEYMASLGLRSPRLMALAAGSNELVGGALIGLGLLTPLGAALIASTMIVAARTDHRGKGLWNDNGGFELPLTNAVLVLALAFAGAGRWSLDHALGLDLASTGWGVAAAAVAIAGAVGVLAVCRREPAGVPVAA